MCFRKEQLSGGRLRTPRYISTIPKCVPKVADQCGRYAVKSFYFQDKIAHNTPRSMF